MKFSSAAIALVAAAASAVQGHDLLKNVFSLDCDGSIYLFNNFPTGTGLKVKGPVEALNTVIGGMKERAECACPDHSEEDFNLMFDPVSAFLNNFNENSHSPSQCLLESLPRSLHGMNHLVVLQNFPSSCNYDKWTADGYCGLSYDLPDAAISIQAQIRQCPDSYLPSVTVSCTGDDCEKGFSLCRNANDCANDDLCVDLLNKVVPGEFGDPDDVADRYFDIFSGWIYDDEAETSPGCFQENRGTAANPTKDNDILARLTYLLYKHLFGWEVTSFRPQVCDSDILTKLVDAIKDESNNGSHFEFGGFDENAITHTELILEDASCLLESNNVTAVSLVFLGGLGKELDDHHIENPTFATPSTNKFPLIQATCDMQVKILDRFSTRINGKVVPLINDVFNFFYDVSSCRYSPDLTLDQYVSRFIIPNPLFLLGVFDDTASFNRGKDLPINYNVRDAAALFDEIDVQLTGLPCGLTQSYYIQNGKVTAKWTGLSTLFGLDVAIEVTVQKCSNSDIWNSITVDCVGKDCERFLSGLTQCSNNNQCGGEGMICSRIDEFLEKIEEIADEDGGSNNAKRYGGKRDSSPELIDNDHFFETIKDIFSAECDIVEAVFGPSAGSFCGEIDIDFETKTSPCFTETQCFGPSKYAKDLHRVLMAAFGKPGSTLPTNANDYLKFCMVDIEALMDRDFETWTNSLVTVDEATHTIKINHLGDACGADDSSSSDASSVKAFSFLTIFLISVIVLLF